MSAALDSSTLYRVCKETINSRVEVVICLDDDDDVAAHAACTRGAATSPSPCQSPAPLPATDASDGNAVNEGSAGDDQAHPKSQDLSASQSQENIDFPFDRRNHGSHNSSYGGVDGAGEVSEAALGSSRFAPLSPSHGPTAIADAIVPLFKCPYISCSGYFSTMRELRAHLHKHGQDDYHTALLPNHISCKSDDFPYTEDEEKMELDDVRNNPTTNESKSAELKRIEEIEEENAKLKRELEQVRENEAALNAQIAEWEKKCGETNKQLKRYRTERDRLSEDNKKFQNTVENLLNVGDSKEKAVNMANERLAKLEKEKRSLQELCNSAKKELLKVRSAKSAVESELKETLVCVAENEDKTRRFLSHADALISAIHTRLQHACSVVEENKVLRASLEQKNHGNSTRSYMPHLHGRIAPPRGHTYDWNH